MAAATIHRFPASVDALLRAAIRERRIISFTLHGLARRAEPHDYGVIKGVTKLFFYQVGGQSSSGRPLGWRWAIISDIVDLSLLEDRFRGARDTPSGHHAQWDRLFASVAREIDDKAEPA
jgi:hypothetical protein